MLTTQLGAVKIGSKAITKLFREVAPPPFSPPSPPHMHARTRHAHTHNFHLQLLTAAHLMHLNLHPGAVAVQAPWVHQSQRAQCRRFREYDLGLLAGACDRRPRDHWACQLPSLCTTRVLSARDDLFAPLQASAVKKGAAGKDGRPSSGLGGRQDFNDYANLE